jgi:hypothetical protein
VTLTAFAKRSTPASIISRASPPKTTIFPSPLKLPPVLAACADVATVLLEAARALA